MGDPIEHSKSPAMHNAWFEDMSIDATYIPLHVTPDQLESAVAGLKTLGASGWNVTIPHKTAIIPYLDELDELAQKMGAVNTVVRTTEGKLKGYNTDGIGFVRSLEEAVGVSHKDKPVLLVGAGESCSRHCLCYAATRLSSCNHRQSYGDECTNDY